MKILSAVVFAASFGLLASACAKEEGEEKAGSPEVETGEVAQAAFGSWSPFNGSSTYPGVMGLWGRNVGGVTHAHAVSLQNMGTFPSTFTCRLEEHTPTSASQMPVGGLGSCSSYIGGADAATRDDVYWAAGGSIRDEELGVGAGPLAAGVPATGPALSVRSASFFPGVTDMWFTTGTKLRQSYRTSDAGTFVAPYDIESVPSGTPRQPGSIWTDYAGDSVLSVLVPTSTGMFRVVYRASTGWDSFPSGPSVYFDDASLTYSPPKSGVAIAERNPGQIRFVYVGRISTSTQDEVCVRYSNNGGTTWFPGGATPSAICLGAPAAGIKQVSGVYATPAAVSKGGGNIEILVEGADNLIYTYTMSF